MADSASRASAASAASVSGGGVGVSGSGVGVGSGGVSGGGGVSGFRFTGFVSARSPASVPQDLQAPAVSTARVESSARRPRVAASNGDPVPENQSTIARPAAFPSAPPLYEAIQSGSPAQVTSVLQSLVQSEDPAALEAALKQSTGSDPAGFDLVPLTFCVIRWAGEVQRQQEQHRTATATLADDVKQMLETLLVHGAGNVRMWHATGRQSRTRRVERTHRWTHSVAALDCALLWAVHYGRTDCALQLLSNGADGRWVELWLRGGLSLRPANKPLLGFVAAFQEQRFPTVQAAVAAAKQLDIYPGCALSHVFNVTRNRVSAGAGRPQAAAMFTLPDSQGSARAESLPLERSLQADDGQVLWSGHVEPHRFVHQRRTAAGEWRSAGPFVRTTRRTCLLYVHALLCDNVAFPRTC